MTSRIRILITALLVCHLLLAPGLVTSQFRPSPAPAGPPPGPAPAIAQTAVSPPTSPSQSLGANPVPPAPPAASDEVTIEAQQQEKAGDTYSLRGDVVITYGRLTLRADEMTYNAATGDATASGHLRLDGGVHDEHLEATHGSYNVRTQSGKFYDVIGTIGARSSGRGVLLTSSTPFFFRGREVEQTGPNRYVVSHGEVTSCELPHPKWVFNAGKATVEVGAEAKLYHSTFRLGGIPVFYFPYVQHPVEKLGRQSGFLIPTIGQSSVKGTILGDSFYWAINRSLDATVGAEYFSRRGWSQHLDFRARPSDSSFLDIRYFGVLDRGLGSPPVDQGGEDVRLSGEARLGHGVRAVADIDYLSSYIFRLAFAESFTQAVNSEVRSNAFISKSSDGFYFNVLGSRYQNYESTQRGDLITILHAPSLDLDSAEHQLGKAPAYWSYDVALQGVSRREPNFVTDPLVGRFDLEPRLAMPLVLGGWSVRPEVALRETYYTQGRIPTSGIGVPSDQAVERRALETSLELRPPEISRIFRRKLLNHTFKHVIEPQVTYRYVTGVDNFANIIRFDARDILSNTNEVEYALVQRLFTKPVSTGPGHCSPPQEAPPEGDSGLPSAPAETPPGSPAPAGDQPCGPGTATARNVLTWEVAQKAFFNQDFGGALVPGQRNMLTTTSDLTGIAFLTDPRRFSPVISRFRLDASRNTDGEWELDYDSKKGHISSSTAIVNYHFGQFFIGGSHAFFQALGELATSTPLPPPTDFNQFRWLAGYGNPNKRGISAAANIGFDVNSGFLQYSAFQSSYNWDCCGISFEYRRFALGAVRNENQFRFALSLTNVGTFGTLRRQERLF